MKRLSLMYLLLLIVCCARDGDSGVRTRLEKWDEAIWNRNYQPGDTLYDSLLDSLHTLDIGNLPKKDVAHYCLLHTLLGDKTGENFENDSLIMDAIRYYEMGTDYYNQARSLLYAGVVRHEMDKGDTVAFRMMKKAESIVSEIKVTNISLVRVKALLYSRMGKMLYDDQSYVSAEDYFKRSAEEYKSCGDIGNYYIVMTDIVWCHLVCNEYEKALELLDSFDTSALPDYILSNIYNAYSTYYYLQEEYVESIKYTKKQIAADARSGKVLNSNDYYALSDTYSYVDADSAVYYADKMLETIDTSDMNIPYYYKQYAESLYGTGDYKSAYDSLYRSWELLDDNIDRIAGKRIVELERKFNYSQMERLAERERNHKNTVALVAAAFILILCMAVLFFWNKRKLEKKNSDKIMSMNHLLEIVCDITSHNNSIIPKITSGIGNLHNKYVSLDGVSGDCNRLLLEIKKEQKRNLSEIATNIKRTYQDDKVVSSLTDKEIIIRFLKENGFNSGEIARIMSVSDHNVSATHSRIRKKSSGNSAKSASE